MKNIRIIFVGPGLAGSTTCAGALLTNPSVDWSFYPDQVISWPPSQPRLTVTISILRKLFGPVIYTARDREAREDLERLATADGAIFVVDSQASRTDRNADALDRLVNFLSFVKRRPESLPLVFILNKQDLPTALPESELVRAMSWPNAEHVPSVAVRREGVVYAFSRILDRVLVNGSCAGTDRPPTYPQLSTAAKSDMDV
jgi:signal recognition particle receptor subunit beta